MTEPRAADSAPLDSAMKVLVAVHGIGDQTAFETAQSVAFRFYEHYQQPPAIPLGRFYNSADPEPGWPELEPSRPPSDQTHESNQSDPAPRVLVLTGPPDPAKNVMFAEVYWASVPRALVKEGYTLEEAKRWARSIAARLNVQTKSYNSAAALKMGQYVMLETALEELIEAIYVLESVTFLAAAAGLFKFNLKKLVNDYLNDVQVVTEFEVHRDEILRKFATTMEKVHGRACRLTPAKPDPELYVIAHSEGSVVALMGLLHALSSNPIPEWATCVRGLMTIGSPIETHLILWQHLWDRFDATGKDPAGRKPIAWWNYYDYGDPIAYKLERTRDWMTARGWGRFFDHSEANDIGFARYLFPGKAHIDYWRDQKVFDHFFDEVVHPPPRLRADGSDDPATTVTPVKPRARLRGQLVSPAMPFAFVLALMFVAAYAVYRPVSDALFAGQLRATAVSAREAFFDVCGLVAVMAGLTAVMRIPRLSRALKWRIGAVGVSLAGLLIYTWAISETTGTLIEESLRLLPLPSQIPPLLSLIASIVGTLLAVVHLPFPYPATTTVFIVNTLIASLVGWKFPRLGVKPVVASGAFVAALIVFGLLFTPTGHKPVSLSPIVLGSAIFLYGWWLASLLFDLTFAWHTYIRWATALDHMRLMAKSPVKNG